MNRAVFLDRDGVINRAYLRDGVVHPPQSPEEFELLPGVPEAARLLRDAGFRLIVVTNQPDVGAGRQAQTVVEEIHEHLRTLLPVDDIRVCYHTDEDGCACRKPKPGMLLDAAAYWNVDLGASVLVGDRWRDIDAGRAAGCRTVLIESDYDGGQASGYDAAVPTLLEASRLILSHPTFQASRQQQR